MSIVSESKPWCDITSAEKALGIDSQPFTTASPFFQISLSLFARTGGLLSHPRPLTGPGAPRIIRARIEERPGFAGALPRSLRRALHHQVAAVAGVRAHLAGPASLVHGLGEGLAQQHV